MEMLFSVPHSCSANWAAGAECWVHLDVDSVSAEQLPGDTSFEVVMSDSDSVEFDANPSLDITPSRATHTANMPGCLGRSRGECIKLSSGHSQISFLLPYLDSFTLHFMIFCPFRLAAKA